MTVPYITPEQFCIDYKDYVYKWVKLKNRTSHYPVDKDDFWSSLMEKILTKNTLSKYDPDHPSKASFKTWLNTVLHHLHVDAINDIAKRKYLTIHTTIEEYETKGGIPEPWLEYEEEEDEYDCTREFDYGLFIPLINSIKNVEQRVIMKLKLFYREIFSFEDAELRFMSQESGLSLNQINDFILKNKKKDGGFKNKDISILTGYSISNVNTKFQQLRNVIEKARRDKFRDRYV